jgi:hypothetical protein
MEEFVLDVLAVSAGVTLALTVLVGIGFFWARRRFRMMRTRLLVRVAGGDLSPGGLGAAARINRHGVSTAIVRRRLRVDVDGAVTAVHQAERAGAPIGDLGALAADLEVAARSLDAAMASMGSSGVTPVVRTRARELDASAKQLRHRAERLLAATAVPGQASLVEAIKSIDDEGRRSSFISWSPSAQ